MPKFKARQKLVQTVIQLYWEEFDTEDQEQWDSLKTGVEEGSAKDVSKFPENAPSDPNIWFDLYKMLNYKEYENAEKDDWVSDCNGFTEYFFELEDSEGNIIESSE